MPAGARSYFLCCAAADTDGAVAFYQDDELVAERTDLITDDSDRARCYVGNLAESITPSESTLYVDDVEIRITP